MSEKLPVFFLIYRADSDGTAFALVRGFVSDPQLTISDNFCLALKRALTAWAKESETGRNMWEASVHDFNIGDLSTIGPYIREGKVEDALVIALAEQGISSMEVKCYGTDDVCSNWTYDTILMDGDELPELEDDDEDWEDED